MEYTPQNNVMESPAEVASPSVNFRHYWYVLLERRWIVIWVFALVVTASLVYLYKAPKVYAAVTRLQINNETENSLNLREGGTLSMGAVDLDYLQTQYKNILSRNLVELVIKKELLGDDPRYNLNVDIVAAVADDIRVQPIRLTRLVDIQVEHNSAQKAAAIANALANEFIKWTSDQRQNRSMRMFGVLKGQAKQTETEVSIAEENLQAYRETTKYVSLDNQQDNFIAANLNRAEAMLQEARARTETAQTVVDQLAVHTNAHLSLETFPYIAKDLRVGQLQTQLAGLENELAGLSQKYGRRHPAVVQIKSRIDDTKKTFNEAIAQVVQTLQAEVVLAKAQQTNVVQVVNDWQDRQMKWMEARTRYDVLKRQEETSTALYNLVLSKMKELDIVQNDRAENILQVYAATAPVEPAKPNIPLVLVGGGVSALLLAIGLAFFVNFLDDSIKSQDDVETYLRLPFFGYVPNIKTNSVVERYLQSHLYPQSNAAESFRTTRAAVSLGPQGEKLRVLAVTCTLPNEGKSLVACNLAIVIAQTGLKTLLVDADLHRPTFQKTFQLKNPVGLTTYLTEKVNNINELINTTEVPNLDVVSSGEVAQQPSELIASRRMVQFLQEVSKRYDRVIIDCTPVLAFSDPLVLSAMADGVIYVVKFNKVRRDHARKSIQRLHEVGASVCGVLLNNIDFEGRDSYYYSYYYLPNRHYSTYYRNRESEVEATADKTTKA